MTLLDPINVNGRSYAAPKTCAIVICLDGCEPEYLDVAISEGFMPNLARIKLEGTSHLENSVIPSFTNPNNMSIANGCPPAFHGICGKFLYDPDIGDEEMINDVRFPQEPTIPSKYYKAGARIAAVTAKDKLRALLGAGLSFEAKSAICFSSERADEATKLANGIENASHWLGRDVPKV